MPRNQAFNARLASGVQGGYARSCDRCGASKTLASRGDLGATDESGRDLMTVSPAHALSLELSLVEGYHVSCHQPRP